MASPNPVDAWFDTTWIPSSQQRQFLLNRLHPLPTHPVTDKSFFEPVFRALSEITNPSDANFTLEDICQWWNIEGLKTTQGANLVPSSTFDSYLPRHYSAPHQDSSFIQAFNRPLTAQSDALPIGFPSPFSSGPTTNNSIDPQRAINPSSGHSAPPLFDLNAYGYSAANQVNSIMAHTGPPQTISPIFTPTNPPQARATVPYTPHPSLTLPPPPCGVDEPQSTKGAGAIVNTGEEEDGGELEAGSSVEAHNIPGSNRRPRLQLLRERKRSLEEVAISLFAKETNNNWRELTEERRKTKNRDSNYQVNTYMEIVKEHWQALPQEQKDGFLSSAREVLAQPPEKDPKKENLKVVKKFRDLARVARDKHGVASFMLLWTSQSTSRDRTNLSQFGFPGAPTFLTWLEAKSNKDAGQLRDYLIEYGEQTHAGGSGSGPHPTSTIPIESSVATPISFAYNTPVRHLRPMLRDHLKQRWFICRGTTNVPWRAIKDAPHLYCNATHLPKWWEHGDPTELNHAALVHMLSYLQEGDEGRLAEGATFRWYKSTLLPPPSSDATPSLELTLTEPVQVDAQARATVTGSSTPLATVTQPLTSTEPVQAYSQAQATVALSSTPLATARQSLTFTEPVQANTQTQATVATSSTPLATATQPPTSTKPVQADSQARATIATSSTPLATATQPLTSTEPVQADTQTQATIVTPLTPLATATQPPTSTEPVQASAQSQATVATSLTPLATATQPLTPAKLVQANTQTRATVTVSSTPFATATQPLTSTEPVQANAQTQATIATSSTPLATVTQPLTSTEPVQADTQTQATIAMSLTPLAIGTQPLVPTESVQASAQSQTTVPTSSTPLAAAKQPPSSDAAPLSAITNNVSLGSQAVRRSGRQVASSLEPPKKTTGKRVHETSALAKAVQTRSGRVVQVPQANKRPKK